MQVEAVCHLAVLFSWILAPLGSRGQNSDKWGPWGEWSPCSRTCGVGVTYQERECFEKEKPENYCKGNKRVYTTCNIQDCPEGSRDFRLEQCEAYNNRDLDGRRFKWVPYIPSHERCALNCMPKGENFFMLWADKVVDGTRCSVDSYDICVDGKCAKLGCDLILNSTAKEDKCRVCNGIGENCKTHEGVITDEGEGYKEVLVIPASATNIDIQEMAPSLNFLALADSSRSYFFNGNYVITPSRKFHIAGTVFNYQRTRFGQERISSLGPTSIPVHLEILSVGRKNPGISYEFSLPTSVTVLPKRAQFSWQTGEFDKCSASCAGGEQKRRVYCVRDNTGEEVFKSNCDHGKKPSHKQKCNTQPCPASWYVSSWSPCSVTCGRGKHVRRVHCQQVVEGGNAEMIPDDQCPGRKAITMRVCVMLKRCPVWSVGPWSKCSVACGVGSRHRNLTCQVLDTKQIFKPESCNPNKKPKDAASCNPGPCTVTWMATEWSECYPKCGKGMSTRMVYCVSISDKTKKYPDDLCEASSRPISEKNCSSDVLCPPMWHASEWSKCTASCGVGMQMRNVYCATKEGPKMLRILANNRCAKEKKISSVQKCSVKPCQAGWYIYPWEPCSKTCGQGVRRRDVKCFADSKEDPEEKWCKAEDKPDSEERCFEEECKEVRTTPKTPEERTKTALKTVSTAATIPTKTKERDLPTPPTSTEEQATTTKASEGTTSVSVQTQTAKTEKEKPTTTASPATRKASEGTSTAARQTQTMKTVEEERTTSSAVTTSIEETTTMATSKATPPQTQTKTDKKEPTTTASPTTRRLEESTTREASEGTSTAVRQTQTMKTVENESTTSSVVTTSIEETTTTATSKATPAQNQTKTSKNEPTTTALPTTRPFEESTTREASEGTSTAARQIQTMKTVEEERATSSAVTASVEETTTIATSEATQAQTQTKTDQKEPTTTASPTIRRLEESTTREASEGTSTAARQTQTMTTVENERTSSSAVTTSVEKTTTMAAPKATPAQTETKTDKKEPTTTASPATRRLEESTTTETSEETSTAARHTQTMKTVEEERTTSSAVTTSDEKTTTIVTSEATPAQTQTKTDKKEPTTTASPATRRSEESTTTETSEETSTAARQTQTMKTVEEERTTSSAVTTSDEKATTIVTSEATPAQTQTKTDKKEPTTTASPKSEASTTTGPPSTKGATTSATPLPTAELSTASTQSPITEASTSTLPESTTEGPTTARRIQPAKIFQTPQDTNAYVGTEILFRCRATGYPQPMITWRKGSIPVSSLDLHRMQILPDGDLRISSITEDDSDTYTCTATNFVGPMDAKQARLIVLVPVSVAVSPKTASAQYGTDVTITCQAHGIPRPIVEWYKDDTFLSSDGRMQVSNKNVIISRVQSSDSGHYECHARNDYGNDVDRMYLNVLKKKEPTTKPPEKCEDNPLVAHCPVVKRVGFCCITFYQKACCYTCRDLLPGCKN